MEDEIRKKRGRFRKFLGEILKFARISDENPDEDCYIVVTATEEWDRQHNAVWELWENKSFTRNARCHECSRFVVMSNGMWEKYIDGGKKAKLICGRDFKNFLEQS